MKTNYIKIIIAFVCVVFTIVIIMITNQNSTNSLKSEFNKWETTEIFDNEKDIIIDDFMEFLSVEYVDKKQLNELSPYIKVFDYDDFQIFQYNENPEIYGNSSRYSYYIIYINGYTDLIIEKDSIIISDILQVDENEYIFVAEDYKFSNMTGIRIFRLKIIDNKAIIESNIIDDNFIPNGLNIIVNSIYSVEGNLNYSIEDKQILLNNSNKKYKLILNANRKYLIEKY